MHQVALCPSASWEPHAGSLAGQPGWDSGTQRRQLCLPHPQLACLGQLAQRLAPEMPVDCSLAHGTQTGSVSALLSESLEDCRWREEGPRPMTVTGGEAGLQRFRLALWLFSLD